MPIKFYMKDLEFFQDVYLVSDNKQLPWQVTGVYLDPNGPRFTLSRAGYDDVEVYDGQFTTKENTVLRLKSDPDSDE